MKEEYDRPVLLVIRDGWGENHHKEQDAYNAIKLAKKPISDALSAQWPRTEIKACGLDVGLPEGVMGNSEVGHQNIGAGRIVDQEIVRINKAINGGELKDNEVLQRAFKGAMQEGKKLHLMGLLSDAGVHAMKTHLEGLLSLAKDAGVENVFIHIFADGRDTPPRSGLGYVEELEEYCQKEGIGRIASVTGRYWAMDRDKRWDRVKRAYDCLVGKRAEFEGSSAKGLIEDYYNNPVGETMNGDEFITPRWVVGEDGKPIGRIGDGDSVIFYNFRGDRPRELTRAFIDKKFDGFDREKKLDLYFVTMTEYEKGLCEHVLFYKPEKMKNILGEYIADKGIGQFRCAETEKYPHVTFFFNDYRDEPFKGEERALVQSPKDVATYDQKPEMSADGVCEAAKDAIKSKRFGLVVVNFANTDMVGHTGSLRATMRAAEVVDKCLGELLEEVDKVGGVAIITADHGNADQMWNEEVKSPHTQHTLNPVEVVVYGKGYEERKLRKAGRLADLAPTILDIMGIGKPVEMSGESLLLT